jgi:hypothetical protein
MQVTGIRSVIDQETLLAACGRGDIVELPAMAPVTLATLQGSTDADPAAVAAAVAARPLNSNAPQGGGYPAAIKPPTNLRRAAGK